MVLEKATCGGIVELKTQCKSLVLHASDPVPASKVTKYATQTIVEASYEPNLPFYLGIGTSIGMSTSAPAATERVPLKL